MIFGPEVVCGHGCGDDLSEMPRTMNLVSNRRARYLAEHLGFQCPLGAQAGEGNCFRDRPPPSDPAYARLQGGPAHHHHPTISTHNVRGRRGETVVAFGFIQDVAEESDGEEPGPWQPHIFYERRDVSHWFEDVTSPQPDRMQTPPRSTARSTFHQRVRQRGHQQRHQTAPSSTATSGAESGANSSSRRRPRFARGVDESVEEFESLEDFGSAGHFEYADHLEYAEDFDSSEDFDSIDELESVEDVEIADAPPPASRRAISGLERRTVDRAFRGREGEGDMNCSICTDEVRLRETVTVLPWTKLCSDGRTICPGAKSQCTVDVSVYVDQSGGAVSRPVCCAPGQKALNGACFDGRATLVPCYQNGRVPYDWTEGYYCAWSAGNDDSRCCKLDEYYKGNARVKKPRAGCCGSHVGEP
ncbi:uncharacterized protein MAM_06395 [Metarhizium album ARSEF 1941]|uniref:Uncharacterized protein n=1 Tax=Metarhizium album (strain ARSEF 1941) TaxID=1081103 RepID=A0A0B2WP49_METAS|nr:uncharacterized protein MAM_06395 [Metarhizium album ARSEF 1941]KHN95783.1 hypothetical protein MAM_06395 [Metarhizium album ARSEF 1941]